jgi:stearoyl-CoA desaturase (delta-9 desaturase)
MRLTPLPSDIPEIQSDPRGDMGVDPVTGCEPAALLANEEENDLSIVTPAPEEQTSVPPEAPLIHTIGSLVGITMPFLGLLAAMVYSWQHGWLDWTQLSIMIVGQLLTALGLTLGYHRLLTHRSFSTYYWVRVFWMMMGALALQKSPIEWCATHRKHHALSDKPGDPHTPYDYAPGFINTMKGFWHAHVGWIMTGHIIATDQKRYVPDLLQDPVAVWIHRYWEIVWFPLTFIIPTLVAWGITGTGEGALLGFLWGGCARVFIVQHITFSVNSICHMFGRKEYHSNDESRNNFICGILSAGEGFHNTHHAFPTSARHGLEWWQPDLTWYVIKLHELCGLAWDIKLPSEEQRQRKRIVPQNSQ